MNINNLPKIPLSTNQRIWLTEAWKLLWDSGEKVSYQRIRANTIDRTGLEFNPHDIDKRLLVDKASSITMLGLLLVDSDKELINVADRIILHIKNRLLENPDFKGFKILELSKELDIDEKSVGLVFYFLQYVNGFYDGAGSSGEHRGVWYERYELKSDHVFDNYMRFTSFESYLGEFYKKDLLDESRRVPGSKSDAGDQFLYEAFKHLSKEKCFVNTNRIKELQALGQNRFDTKKLISLCNELNVCYDANCFYSTAFITRAIIDHVPPIFDKTKFSEVVGGYGSRSFKDSMLHLEKSMRKIADSHLHTQIRQKESLPNRTQVDFSRDLDVLLGEVIRVLS